MGLFEEVIDCVQHPMLVYFALGTKGGAVKGCNDGNEGDRVGKGKLRVLGAFKDLSESIGSQNGNCGFGCLLRVQFKLDFNFHTSKKGQKSTII
jgi:hypothetical protein